MHTTNTKSSGNTEILTMEADTLKAITTLVEKTTTRAVPGGFTYMDVVLSTGWHPDTARRKLQEWRYRGKIALVGRFPVEMPDGGAIRMAVYRVR